MKKGIVINLVLGEVHYNNHQKVNKCKLTIKNKEKGRITNV